MRILKIDPKKLFRVCNPCGRELKSNRVYGTSSSIEEDEEDEEAWVNEISYSSSLGLASEEVNEWVSSEFSTVLFFIVINVLCLCDNSIEI